MYNIKQKLYKTNINIQLVNRVLERDRGDTGSETMTRSTQTNSSKNVHNCPPSDRGYLNPTKLTLSTPDGGIVNLEELCAFQQVPKCRVRTSGIENIIYFRIRDTSRHVDRGLAYRYICERARHRFQV